MSSLPAASVQTLCILRLSALGDVCNLLPSVRALQEAWPDTEITWVIGSAEYSLLAGLEGVNFLVYDKKTGVKGLKKLRQALFERQGSRPFDLLLHMQAALRASLLSLFLPARRRIGFDRDRAKDFQRLFVQESLAPHPRQHVGEGFLDFVRHLGIQPVARRWDLPLPPQAWAEAARWQQPEQPYLLLSPCSSDRAHNWRNWSDAGYAAVIDYAYERYGLTTLLTGGRTPLEAQTAQALMARTRAPLINAVGKTSLKALACLIQKAALVIAPDSGPIHLAAAVKTPPLGLYATSNPDRTGPWWGREWVVNRYPEAVQQFLGRHPDQLPWGQRVRHPQAMQLITPADVFERLDAIMNRQVEHAN